MMPTITSLPSSSCSSSSSTSTGSPCAACKFLRRKCQPDCVFAPYFPPDNPQKFVHVHRIFGASNVTKILNDLPACHREDAVNSLAYEADMRLRDPVYGCVGVISILQHQLRQLQLDLSIAKAELAKYQNVQHQYNYYQHPQQQQQNVVTRNYEAASAALAGVRMGVIGGGYDGNINNNGALANVRVLGGQFLKTSGSINVNGGEERRNVGPS